MLGCEDYMGLVYDPDPELVLCTNDYLFINPLSGYLLQMDITYVLLIHKGNIEGNWVRIGNN